MDDTELEQFCRQWVERKTNEYFEVKRFGGAGDKGRDVVGFCTACRHDAAWHNYQCKQYRTKLGKNEGLLAVGKVLYWASQGEFTAPEQFIFVAPKGLNSSLLRLVNKPDSFKSELIGKWDEVCAKQIVRNVTIDLSSELLATLQAYDFSTISFVDVDEMITHPAAKPLLFELFGSDPGDFPKGSVPLDLQEHEIVYLDALLAAYNERESNAFGCHQDVLQHDEHGDDLRIHRARYYEADGFQKFYRDNTSPETIEEFRRGIRFGIHETLKAPAADQLKRIGAIMTLAGSLKTAGPLSAYAYIGVRQGLCHHLVNDGEITWKGPK